MKNKQQASERTPGKISSADGEGGPKGTGGRTALRRPDLPPEKRGNHGVSVGEKCGVVRGKSDPCEHLLYADPDDGKARCDLHCRHETRNADSLSVLCPQWRMKGRKGCSRHGGKARTGALHPGYKEGKHSRWAPHVSKKRSAVARALAEGDPLDLMDDLALMRTRAVDLLANVDAAGLPDFSQALPLAQKAKKAVSDADDGAALRALDDLCACLTTARGVERAWDKLDDVMKTTTKMVESQRKRAVEGHKLVTVEDVMEMITAMGRSLRQKVEELLPKEQGDRLLTEVQRDWAAAQGVDDAPTVEAEGTM